MQIGIVGLGRMGANMARRLLRAGHACVVFDARRKAVEELAQAGAEACDSLQALVRALIPPRTVWLMLPAVAVDAVIDELMSLLAGDDSIVDGGNSHYRDALRHARDLSARGIHFIDVGTSGGVWGLQEGYCLMIGGERAPVAKLTPIFQALAPADAAATKSTAAQTGTASQGFLHCGPVGAGHFVKMVHNGIEYSMMAGLAEGLNLLVHANRGRAMRASDAETAPLTEPEAYAYDLDLPAITELWRHGSVVRSWLLDLTAGALRSDPDLERFTGRVSDSGEGRWTLQAAIDLGIPMPQLAAALFERFASQNEQDFANKVLSAMRLEFGGHEEKTASARSK
jgi:6-phosphogluconate dehydrogenase